MARALKEKLPGMKTTAAVTKLLADGMSQSWEDSQSETVMGDAWFGNMATLRAICGTPGPGRSTRHCIFNIKGGAQGLSYEGNYSPTYGQASWDTRHFLCKRSCVKIENAYDWLEAELQQSLHFPGNRRCCQVYPLPQAIRNPIQ